MFQQKYDHNRSRCACLFLNRFWISRQQPLGSRSPAALPGEPAGARHLLQVVQQLLGVCQQLPTEQPGIARFAMRPLL